MHCIHFNPNFVHLNQSPSLSMYRFLIAALLFSSVSYGQCDVSLWDHVYNRTRLLVHESCTTVTGTVEDIFGARDGDYHINIRLDSGFNWMLNDLNRTEQYGCIVAEPICAKTIVYASAKAACGDHVNTVYLPNVGEHVAVRGAYVTDNSHGWNEIHPVTAIWITTETSSTPLHEQVIPKLSVYPNPADNEINFELSTKPSSTIQITILDALGQLAGQFQMFATSKLTIPTRILPKGIYYYHLVQNEKEQKSGSFIVK